jgi:hypothetical protein
VRSGWLWRHQNLIVLVVVALAAIVAVGLSLHPAIRVVLAIPLVFYAPGYVLQAALLPTQSLQPLERFLVSVGGSVVVTILTGLVLAWADIPLEPISWTVALAAFTVVGAAIAWFRHRNREPEPSGHGLPPMRWREAVPILIAVVGTVGILLGTRVLASGQEEPPPAQLWLIPHEDSFDARLGMRAGGVAGDYTIRLTSAGQLLESYTEHLDPGEAWERVVSFTEEEREQPIVGRLYLNDIETELRFVVLQPPADAG